MQLIRVPSNLLNDFVIDIYDCVNKFIKID